MEQFETPKRRPRRPSPYQRNRNLQGKWLGRLLMGTVAVFLILSLLIPDKAFSESENRPLAQKPGKTELLAGTYLSQLDSWFADQFPARDFWMTLNLRFNRLLGQKEASGVYLCENGVLMQAPSEPNAVQVQRNLDAINAFTKLHPELNMVMTVVPNAVTVHSELLPENAPVRNQREDLKRIKAALSGVNFVDVTNQLRDCKNEYLFYYTDHHWTSLGAYHAFEELSSALDIPRPVWDSFTVYPVSDSFEGTLSSKSGSHERKDTVHIYVSNSPIDYYVTYADSGKTVSSLYSRAALDAKDHYTVFFGGNYSRVDITTTADTGRSLLLFKDSYANCMVQFLYPHFDHITMIDPRYYYDNVELVIKSEGITDVLFLYNLDTYLSDTSLADVLISQ